MKPLGLGIIAGLDDLLRTARASRAKRQSSLSCHGPLVLQAGRPPDRPPRPPAIRQPGLNVIEEPVYHALRRHVPQRSDADQHNRGVDMGKSHTRHPALAMVSSVNVRRAVIVGKHVDRGPSGLGDKHLAHGWIYPVGLGSSRRAVRRSYSAPPARMTFPSSPVPAVLTAPLIYQFHRETVRSMRKKTVRGNHRAPLARNILFLIILPSLSSPAPCSINFTGRQ